MRALVYLLRNAVLLSACLLGSWTRAGSAQVLGTQCWSQGGVLQCNSQIGLLYNPGPAMLRRSFDRLIQTIEEQKAMQAQARLLAAAKERQRAAFRLFQDKAFAVVRSVADSLRMSGPVATRFAEAISPSLADLYTINPVASTEDIRDVLFPHLARLNDDFNAFLYRLVPGVKPSIDSLSLSPPEAALFVQAMLPACQDAFMNDPTQSAETFREGLEPLLARARFYFDSVRTHARRDTTP